MYRIGLKLKFRDFKSKIRSAKQLKEGSYPLVKLTTVTGLLLRQKGRDKKKKRKSLRRSERFVMVRSKACLQGLGLR